MKRFTVLALVVGIALSAGPMSAVHAGSRGFGPGLSFQCYTISDPSPGQVVKLTDPATGTRLATVGPARLLCQPVTGGVCDADFPCEGVNVANVPPQNPDYNPSNLNGLLKCYVLRSSKADNPQVVVNLSDVIQEESVALGGVQFLCIETSDPAPPSP